MKPRRHRQPLITAIVMLVILFSFCITHQTLGATLNITDPIYKTGSMVPFKTYFENQNESINMYSGDLKYSSTDLTLPGRFGLDINITRTYANNLANLYDVNLDSGSVLSFKRTDKYIDKKYPIGSGWSLNFPYIEKKEQASFLHMGTGEVYKILNPGATVSNLSGYYLKDIYYNPSGGNFTYNGISYSYNTSLDLKDGVQYFFNSTGDLIAIRNRFQDTVLFQYISLNGANVISTITDSLGRIISFNYSSTIVTITCFNSSGTENKTVEYHLSPVPGISGKYQLSSVVYKNIDESGDRTVTYEYQLEQSHSYYELVETDPETDGLSTEAVNYYLNLITINHPNGLKTCFEYEKYIYYIADFEIIGDTDLFRVFRRYDQDGTTKNKYHSFLYGQESHGQITNQKTLRDQYGASQISESYSFTNKLLVNKTSQGDRFYQEEKIQYTNQIPSYQEIITKNPATGAYCTLKKVLSFDQYRNLLHEYTSSVEADGKTVNLGEVDYTYDTQNYSNVTKSVKKIDDTTKEIQDFSYDTSGRLTSEVKQLCILKTTAPQTQNQTGLPVNISTSSPWRWSPSIKVNKINVVVNWETGWFWTWIGFTLYYKRCDSPDWVQLNSSSYQGYLGTRLGSTSWSHNLPETTYYEFKITVQANSNWIKVSSASAGNNGGEAYSLLDDASIITTNYEYDPVYKTNVTKITYGATNTSPGRKIYYEYDNLFHTFKKKEYIDSIANPGFGTVGETVKAEYRYDYFGRPTSFIIRKDGMDQETKYTYDNFDRITAQIHLADGSKKTVQYYDFTPGVRSTNKVAITDEDNVTIINEYNAFGQLIKVYRDADNDIGNGNEMLIQTKFYNGLGLVYKEVDSEYRTRIFSYDGKGRLRHSYYLDDQNYPADEVFVDYYDDVREKLTWYACSQGHTIEKYNGLGWKTDEWYCRDPEGQRIQREKIASYQYNLLGQLTRVTDARGQIINYESGIFGLRYEHYRKPDGTQSLLSDFKYDYNSTGELIQKSWKSIATNSAYDCWTKLDYDQAGRLIKKTYSKNNSQILLKYDTANNVTSTYYTHNDGGSSYSIFTDFYFDARNFLNRTSQSINGQKYDIQYNYSNAGKVDSICYPATGTTIRYNYDLFGRLSKIRNNDDYILGTADSPGITYQDSDFITKINYANGMIQEFVPDHQKRTKQILLYHSVNPGTLILNNRYEFDEAGNVIRISDKNSSNDYTYNFYNHLSMDGNTSSVYSYDCLGNRLSKNGKTYTITDRNLISSDGTCDYIYDSLGNLIQKRYNNQIVNQYQYDEEGRLCRILDGNGNTTAAYWYDASGNRVKKDTLTQSKNYIYNGLNVIQEDDIKNGIRNDYVYANNQNVAQITNGIVKYYHRDYLNTLNKVSYSDSPNIHHVGPGTFGEFTLDGDVIDYVYTGKPTDPESGLIYFGARFYDPELGRFITQDPAKVGLNWYEYCANNPLGYVDPDGRCITPANWIGGGIGVISGVAGYSVSTLITGEQWSLKNAAIAGGSSGLVGFVAPWAAMAGSGVLATIGLYAAGNIVQYVATQVANNKEVTATGIAWALITGLAAGKIAGVDKTLASMSTWDPKLIVINSSDAFKKIGEIFNITRNNEIARRAWANLFDINGLRALLSGIGSNVPDYLSDWYQYLKDLYKEQTGTEWSKEGNQ